LFFYKSVQGIHTCSFFSIIAIPTNRPSPGWGTRLVIKIPADFMPLHVELSRSPGFMDYFFIQYLSGAKEKVDLNEILDTAIRIQGPGLEKSRIRVEQMFSPALSPILIDKSRLLQVMINLIKNSCEAIDQAGEVTAAGEKIFEFGESRKGSSGMGLYYCRMFVESNNGTISLTSAGPGQGAVVRVEFSRPTHQSK
jgi:nitrogen fixation/metabolism regulation signal transduction histidine kinase